MRKIGIILTTVLVVVAFVVLSVPFAMGVWIQARYAKMLTEFNTPHLTYQLISFKRGWFQSKAQLQVTLHSAETTLNGESVPLAQFIVNQNILHGPLVRQQHLDGSKKWQFARAAVSNESHAGNLNFQSNSIWTMSNSINTDLQIGHLLLSNDRQRIEVNGLNGQIDYVPSDRHFLSNLNLVNGALYENNPEKVANNNIVDLVKVMELDHFTSHLDIHKINALWYGVRHFGAEKITIYPYGGETLTFSNLTADLNQEQHQGVTHFSLNNHIDSITNGQFKVGQIQVALKLDNMDNNLLENFAQTFMYGSDFQRFKLYPILVDMFAKGMTADLSQLQFNTDDGPVSMQMQIASLPADPSNNGLLHLLESLNIQAAANVPKEWLKKNITSYYQTKKNENPNIKMDAQQIADHLMTYWQDQHFLVPQAQQVSIAINYKNGQLLI
ncbi:MAG: DUF945 family protein, partial [Proteobacteria bacterium]|nr:DUF945 family protein [Pseudomonadota bacterium]